MPVTLKQAYDFIMPNGKRYGDCEWGDIDRLQREASGMPGFQDAHERIAYTLMGGEAGGIDVDASATETLERIVERLVALRSADAHK